MRKVQAAATSQDIRTRVTPLLRAILKTPHLDVRDDLRATDVPEWDSLAHINLIVAIEDEFGVELTTSDHLALRSVGDIIDVLSRRILDTQ